MRLAYQVAIITDRSRGIGTVITPAFARAGTPHSITVNVIAPDLVDTPILVNMTEAEIANYTHQIPMGPIGKPEEIAEVRAYFASNQAGYVTGQILNMSGRALI